MRLRSGAGPGGLLREFEVEGPDRELPGREEARPDPLHRAPADRRGERADPRIPAATRLRAVEADAAGPGGGSAKRTSSTGSPSDSQRKSARSSPPTADGVWAW